MSALPSAVAVTSPDGDTLTSDGADDCQADVAVTSAVVPSERVEVATSCRVSPGNSVADAFPATVTWTDCTTTDGPDGDDDPPQEAEHNRAAMTQHRECMRM